MRRKGYLLIACILAFTILFTGCSKAPVNEAAAASAGEASVRDTIIIGQGSDVTTLDPQMYNDILTESVLLNIYDPIVRVNQKGEIVPEIAEKWDVSEDGKVYTFNIKKGILFQDGKEVKAADVKFTIERCVTSPFVGTYFNYVDKVEEVDDYTVKVTLQYPYNSFLPLLGSFSGVVSKDVVSQNKDILAKSPMGTGPYKFVEWTQGDKLVLEAFDNYHNGKAPIKNLTYKVIGDQSTATIALEKGEVDAYIGISSTDRETVMNNPSLKLSETASYIFRYLGINCDKEPFNNLKVRQAIACALDKEGILIGAEEGVGTVADSHIPKGVIGYSESFKPLEFNVEKAKALLAEAGYPNGFTCKLTTTESRSMHAQIVQSNLKEIGITVDIELLESGTFYENLENGEYDLQILGWSYTCEDPDVCLYDMYKSDTIVAGNYSRYKNPKMDELLINGRKSTNSEERQKIYEEVELIARDDAFNIPLYWVSSNIAFNKDLKGVEASPKKTYFVYNFSW